jgi:hypothetical protein
VSTHKELIHSTRKLARLENNLMREREQQRKQDTRRKIELGGLIIKAKLDRLTKAQILGLLVEATSKIDRDLSSPILQHWQQLGDQAFKK